MVIISAAICDKSGSILVSRQFQNITKMNLEETIKNFPKSISSNQQHTFIETSNLRYIYLPLEELYLLLITNKNSNIIEDLETIRLLHKLVISICALGLHPEDITKNAFDILLSFDDVITFGYRESVTATQVHNSLEMESSEEKLHLMLMKAKLNEAKENAKKHQMEMKKNKMEGQGSGMVSMTGGSGFKSEGFEKANPVAPSYNYSGQSSNNVASSKTSSNLKKGMQLGKKKEANSEKAKVVDEIRKEINRQEKIEKKEELNPLKAQVEILIEEKLNCLLTKDGVLTSFEIIGDVLILCRDKSKSSFVVELEHEKNKQIIIKPHPTLNKSLWNDQSIIGLKESTDNFPINESVPTIKYKFLSTESNVLPFNFTYWLNKGNLTLEVEFNGHQEKFESLENLEFHVSFPSKENPNVKTVESSDYEINKAKGKLIWRIAVLNKQISSANMEVIFSSSISEEDLFPLIVHFASLKPFFNVKPKQILSVVDNSQITFETRSKIITEKFEIN